MAGPSGLEAQPQEGQLGRLPRPVPRGVLPDLTPDASGTVVMNHDDRLTAFEPGMPLAADEARPCFPPRVLVGNGLRFRRVLDISHRA